MTTSEAINELAAALALAQAESQTASKDATNPHYKSRYSTLEAVRQAVSPFHRHGLAFVQACQTASEDGQLVADVETRLIHVSGQWIASSLRIPVAKPDAQGCASAMTYARRIGLAGLAGIAPADDDDAEAAVGRQPPQPTMAAPTKPAGFDDWWADIQSAADMGSNALRSAWEQSPKDYRSHVTAHLSVAWKETKARAEKVSA